jgi:hypothetical protein
VTKPSPDDKYGDVFVDTNKSHEVYKRWLSKPARRLGPTVYRVHYGCRGRINRGWKRII